MKKPSVIALVGPTASGKSDLAVRIALLLKKHRRELDIAGAEIISTDSRQIYRGMDIGTGKITEREMHGVPHHMLNIASPRRMYTVSQFQKRGVRVLNSLIKKNIVPIVCGGTGMYMDSLLYDISFPNIKPDPLLRRQLKNLSAKELYDKLCSLDPERALHIDPHNPRRLVRAIEIAVHMGTSPRIAQPRLLHSTLFLGISPPRAVLIEKIHTRLLARMKKGMIGEVQKLHRSGVSYTRLEAMGLEYRFMAFFLQRKISKEEMLTKLEHEIFLYSKRQMTWFKRNKQVQWIDTPDISLIKNNILTFLRM